jgi:hypothetical protein
MYQSPVTIGRLPAHASFSLRYVTDFQPQIRRFETIICESAAKLTGYMRRYYLNNRETGVLHVNNRQFVLFS